MLTLFFLGQESSSGGSDLFLGEDFFPWMILAFGAAMVVGNVLALVKPPQDSNDDELETSKAPVARAVVLIIVGVAASLWGIASLLS